MSELDWPGNVRQLDNACRWLTVMASGNDIHLQDLPPELQNQVVVDGADDWVGVFALGCKRTSPPAGVEY